MQVLMVDAVKVRREKIRAIRQKHQNVSDERIRGEAKIQLLKDLDLWEGNENVCSADIDDRDPCAAVCSDHVCRDGGGVGLRRCDGETP